MTDIPFVGSPLSQHSVVQLEELAIDLCRSLQIPIDKRTIAHLFPVELSSRNCDAVFFWLDANRTNSSFPKTYKETCKLLMRLLVERQQDWEQEF